MSTIFGHALAAVAASRAPGRGGDGRLFTWPVALAATLLAVAPDLDIVVWIALKPVGMTPHRGPSHSLVVGLALALVAWLIVSGGGRRGGWRLALGLALVSITHPLLDYLMGCGPPVPFLWPFIKEGWLAPVQLVPTAYYSRSFSGLLGVLFSPRLMAGLIFEIGIFGPVLMAQWWGREGSRLAYWSAAALVSGGSVLVVYVLYN